MITVEQHAAGWRVMRRVGGDAASWASVYRLHMRVADAVIPVGGIGGVFTEPAARGKGYARDVLAQALFLMQEQRLAISFLFGVPGLYGRWGFRTCLPQWDVRVRTDDLAMCLRRQRVPTVISHREATPADGAAIRVVYETANARRTGTLQRGDNWHWFKHGSALGKTPIVKVIEGSNGDIDGYIVFDKERGPELAVAELGVRSVNYLPFILQLAVAEGERRRNTWLRLIVPPDHPAAVFVKQAGAIAQGVYTADADGMARIVDMDSLVTPLVPLWERRLHRSDMAGTPVQSAIATDVGSLKFDWDGTKLAVGVETDESRSATVSGKQGSGVTCPQDVLLAAVLGYIPGTALPLYGVSVGERALAFYGTLFPPGEPFMWRPDWF